MGADRPPLCLGWGPLTAPPGWLITLLGALGGRILPSTQPLLPPSLLPPHPAAVGAAVGHRPGAAVPAPGHPAGSGDGEGPGRDLLPLLPQGEQPRGDTHTHTPWEGHSLG